MLKLDRMTYLLPKGRFSVMLPHISEPNLRRPINAIPTYKSIINDIPMTMIIGYFFGFFIAFATGSIWENQAKVVVILQAFQF